MASSLEIAVDEFLRVRLGAERIDDLPLTAPQRSAKKADYFLARRTIVVELKALAGSRGSGSSMVRQVLEEYRRRADWPVLRGALEGSGSSCVDPLSAGLRARVFGAVSRSVSRCAASANEQIGGTARNFRLARPRGVLLLLNERTDDLAPDVLGAAVSDAIRSRRPDGRRTFRHLDAVIAVTGPRTTRDDDGWASSSVLWRTVEERTPAEESVAFEPWFVEQWKVYLHDREQRDGAPR